MILLKLFSCFFASSFRSFSCLFSNACSSGSSGTGDTGGATGSGTLFSSTTLTLNRDIFRDGAALTGDVTGGDETGDGPVDVATAAVVTGIGIGADIVAQCDECKLRQFSFEVVNVNFSRSWLEINAHFRRSFLNSDFE